MSVSARLVARVERWTPQEPTLRRRKSRPPGAERADPPARIN